jgi:hypothetical protein
MVEVFWRLKHRPLTPLVPLAPPAHRVLAHNFFPETEKNWDRRSPVSSVDAVTLQKNMDRLEEIRILLPVVEKNIRLYKRSTKAYTDIIAASSDTSEIVDLAQQKNTTTRDLEAAETERDLLKADEKTALKVVNKNRDEMGKFYRDGPYTTEDRAAFITLVGWGAMAIGVVYFFYSDDDRSMKYRSKIRHSPITAAFKNA